MGSIKSFLQNYFSWLTLPSLSLSVTDVLEIIILSFLVYKVMCWIRETRAWTLLKGILLLSIFVVIAYILQMDTIKYLVTRGTDLALMAAVIIFQPELRRAVERLGERRILNIDLFDNTKNGNELFSDKTIYELIKATVEMGKAKTGALIVIEQNETLEEYERTGIAIDSILTSQLLLNIFEHNTPLHDGAVVVRGDRIVAATCYLPLSNNSVLSKELGTRHRAGVGISEATDSLTIIVSEETGKISYAYKGKLVRDISSEQLKERLVILQNKTMDAKKFRLWKGKAK